MALSHSAVLRAPSVDDEPELLALNNAHAVELSPLTAQSLKALFAASFHMRVADDRQALLVAFDQAAEYGSPNFLWFRERYPKFVYVDRVVVAPAARGRGLARALYSDLFEAARTAGQALVCCEVNVDPPNPVSDRFHEALGFAEVGRETIAVYGKTVRYLSRPLGT